MGGESRARLQQGEEQNSKTAGGEHGQVKTRYRRQGQGEGAVREAEMTTRMYP